jgi:hypothetical protein
MNKARSRAFIHHENDRSHEPALLACTVSKRSRHFVSTILAFLGAKHVRLWKLITPSKGLTGIDQHPPSGEIAYRSLGRRNAWISTRLCKN